MCVYIVYYITYVVLDYIIFYNIICCICVYIIVDDALVVKLWHDQHCHWGSCG